MRRTLAAVALRQTNDLCSHHVAPPDRRRSMKFGIFYELSVPRPWTRETERAGLHERARAGAARRRAGLRPGLGGRAPLPRGVLALLGARAVPHRLRDADEEHPRRPRHRRLRARSSTTRSASPSAPPCSTSSPAAAWSSAPAARRRGPSSAASSANPDDTKKTLGRVRPRASRRCGRRSASATRASSSRCPTRAMLPKPYQKPHPPMWVAVTSPGTELDAADRGLGSLGLTFARLRRAGEARSQEYRRRIQICEPVGAFVNEQVDHRQLPVLPRGRRDRRRDRAAARRHVPVPRRPAARRARGVPDAVVPVARPAAAARARRREPAGDGGRAEGIVHRRPGADHRRREEVGVASASTASTSCSTRPRPCRRSRCSTACACSRGK